MELGPLLTLGILWAVLSVVGRIAGGKKQGGEATKSGPPGQPRAPHTPQRQPESFKDLLELMREQVEAGRVEQTVGGPVQEAEFDGGQDADHEFDQDELTWERPDPTPDPMVVSMEVEPILEERQVHDYQADSQAAIDRRLKVAAGRNVGWKLADHEKFDLSIRSPSRKQALASNPKRQKLREHIVWREILGPPVGLRDRDQGSGN